MWDYCNNSKVEMFLFNTKTQFWDKLDALQISPWGKESQRKVTARCNIYERTRLDGELRKTK